jgi:hypothetical protein
VVSFHWLTEIFQEAFVAILGDTRRHDQKAEITICTDFRTSKFPMSSCFYNFKQILRCLPNSGLLLQCYSVITGTKREKLVSMRVKRVMNDLVCNQVIPSQSKCLIEL